MSTAFSLPPHPLWDFALQMYGHPEIKAACLSLQNDHGLNVNILLFCCWQNQQTLSKTTLGLAIDTLSAWHIQITQKLRNLRKKALQQDKQAYQTLKLVELYAEYYELALLGLNFPKIFDPIDKNASQNNLQLYCQLQNIPLHRKILQLLEPLHSHAITIPC